jgi:hypothetical protein
MDPVFPAHREKVPTEELVTLEMRIAKLDLHPAALRQRNLGSAILLAAIEDYRRLNHEAHNNAKQFLFPQTPEWQEHHNWVVSMADGLNPVWLREALDRARIKWDYQRSARMTARAERRARSAKP